MKRAALMLCALLCTACAALEAPGYEAYLTKKGLRPAPQSESFDHCHAYGCKVISQASLSAEDWQDIEATLTPPPKNAEEERERLGPAIAVFEQKVGAQVGTHEDHWGTFKQLGRYQHDCVDESVNTTVYLSLLKQRNLLRHHDIEAPDARFPLIHAGLWPHQTAVITDTETGTAYAVDSWFHNNGKPAEVVTLKQWKDGWEPEKR